MSWGQRPWRRDCQLLAAQNRGSGSAPPGHPARGRFIVSRQVSWLAGHRFRRAFPGSCPVAQIDVGSPLTVAGAAPALSRSRDRSAPASLLAPKRKALRRTSTSLTMGVCPTRVNTNIKKCLYRYMWPRRWIPKGGSQRWIPWWRPGRLGPRTASSCAKGAVYTFR